MSNVDISRETPLLAYDHITNLMLQGGDTGADHQHIHALIGELRKEGRGTEAFAVSTLHAMLSHIDYGKDDSITATHVSNARTYFVRRLYKRGGPLSETEINQMSPALRALVEIGRLLEVERRPGRIPHQIPRQGMRHIANLLLEKTRPEGLITRHDRDLIVYELFEHGRGTEALAVRYFFNFIDHRSQGIVDQISPQDIEGAVEYSDEKLLRSKDRDNNGYSADEIKKFSTTAKAFLRIGHMIEAGLINTTGA